MFAKKSLGQNFLMHAQTAQRIVIAAQLPEHATVIAIETDDELAPQLAETFAAEIASGNLTIIHDDARTFDTKTLKGEYHLVANIPYYITGELIRSFLTAPHKPRSITFLVQKEVAERIARSKKESLLSLSVKAFGTPEYCFTVPRGAFRPAPNVDSAVLAMRDIDPNALSGVGEEERFFAMLRAGFAHRRKRLAKNLEVVAAPADIMAAFETIGLSRDIRPEDVSLETWRLIASALGEVRAK
jgi:16S rRNA (adenine1518-N6/adenine1519-N6)-dimethyltransferase